MIENGGPFKLQVVGDDGTWLDAANDEGVMRFASAADARIASVRASVHAQGYTLLDAAKGPNGEKRVAIVHVSRNGRVTTDDQGTVVCPVDGSSPYVERPDPAGIVHDVLAKARELFAVYTGDDIRVGIQRVFARWAALPCRVAPPHIVYWLPPAAGEEVRKLADVCDDLGVGRIELFAGSRQDGRSVRAVTTAVNQGLEARLNDFAAEVQRYADADPTKTRVSTMEEKLAEAVRLRQQGEMYRAVRDTRTRTGARAPRIRQVGRRLPSPEFAIRIRGLGVGRGPAGLGRGGGRAIIGGVVAELVAEWRSGDVWRSTRVRHQCWPPPPSIGDGLRQGDVFVCDCGAMYILTADSEWTSYDLIRRIGIRERKG